MLYRSLFSRDLPRDLFGEFTRLSRELQASLDDTPAIRGSGRGGYPALNVGLTPQSVEVLAFAPGLEPTSIEVHLDRGVLTLAGERKSTLPAGDAKPNPQPTVHLNERFDGHFRRVVSLPDDIEPSAVNASYTDGVLRVSVARRAPAQPRRINVQ